MNVLCCRLTILWALVGGGPLLAESGDVTWLREDYTSPDAKLPVQAPAGNPRLTAELCDGLFRLVDSGSEQGDLLTCEKAWCADPAVGASCRVAVKVVRCTGLAGVMIGFSDGVHEDLLTLYPDRIELYRAQLAFAMDTTDDFHVYQVDISGTDVTVSVDSRPVIRAAGGFVFPAHQGRNRFSFGSGASASQGESLWQWVAWTDGSEALRKRWPVIAAAEQVTVFKQDGVYACFPSLRMDPATGCLYTTFSKRTVRTHYETLDATPGVMTSSDGGRTWQDVERLPPKTVGPRPEEVYAATDGSLVRIGQNWRRWFPPEQRPAYEGKYHIVTSASYRPDWFAINSGGFLARSEDGGRNWSRVAIPELDTYASCSSPWSFLPLRDGRLLRSFMVRTGPGDSGDVWVAITRDGRSAELVRVMGDPEQKLRFTEETLAHETSDGVLWLLTRVEGGDDHLWQAVSRDGGRTWTSAKSPIRGHPPCGLVRLADGRLVLTYGYRHPPYGIRAVVSQDEGLTWNADSPIILRNDGAGYDLGYPVSMVLADQTIVTMYYFVQAPEGIHHIACTRWRCGSLEKKRLHGWRVSP